MSAGSAGSRRPPWLGELLMAVAFPNAEREAALGDLAEEYAERSANEGRLEAYLWYWRQVAGSLPPLARLRMRRLARALKRDEGGPPMGELLQDVRYSLRTMRRGPGFAAVVIFTLGLGIAANAIVFSTVDGIVLNPFPYPDGDRLVGVGTAFPKTGSGDLSFVEHMSPAEYVDIAEGSRTLEKIVAWDMGNRELTVGEETENLFTGFWWGDALATLGMQAAVGRGFSGEEIERGDNVAVISHRIWRTRFGGDRSLVGKSVSVNGVPYTLIGVMPPGTLVFGTDLWIPMGVGPEVFPRQARQFQILARLADGATLEEANRELEAIARRIDAEYRAQRPEYEGWRLEARTWQAINVSQFRTAATILLATVGFVLLLVCANIASLLLSRSPARQRELAVRAALGAGRSRILRQLLTESTMLALLGGALGLGLGYVGIQAMGRVIADLGLPLPGQVEVNLRALGFVMLVTLAAGVLFGLLPALQAAGSSIQETLRNEGASATGGVARLRLGRLFVGIEVALALMMLVGGGLMINSLIRLQTVDPGFLAENLLTMRLTLARERYERQQIEPFFQELRDRVGAIPGVSDVATTIQYPPMNFWTRPIWFEGAQLGADDLPQADLTIASPGYFETLGVPLRRGRAFTETDTRDAPIVAVVNETFARRFLPGEDPIGRRFRLGGPDSDNPLAEIIGIVDDTRNRGLDAAPRAEFFVSSIQADGVWNQHFLIIRTQVEPHSIVPQVRQVVRSIDPDQPVYRIRTVQEAFGAQSLVRRVSAGTLSLFAAFALIIAAVGIYGVVAQAAGTRTREIGVRMSLGAQQGQVRRMIVVQALLPVAIGSVVGLLGALALGRLLSGLLYEVSGSDPLTLAVTTAVLAGIALTASYIPARRASLLDPASALRIE